MPGTTADRIRRGLLGAIVLLAATWVPSGTARAGDADSPDRVRRAIAYLDARQDDWVRFAKSGRGEGEDRTTCLSCHTGISFALARPSIGRFVGSPGPSAAEATTVAQVSRRVEHWGDLESSRFRLMYDHDERKVVESWGTEAVLDALILASDDASQGRATPSPATSKALGHLWDGQEAEGPDAGSWDWLQFGLQPWEGEGSRAFGAALAAIAVGSAPGYLDKPSDGRAARGVAALRDYLRRRWPSESLHNRLWIVEASTKLKELLTPDQRREVLDQLRVARREDGGWSLASFGPYRRLDGSARSEASDGYATGLALHALLLAPVAAADRPAVEGGLAWLRSHQRPDGSWPGISVNKERDPATVAGKLMTDAATAFAALALVEAEASEVKK